ncbi:MAG: hypothetical protein ACLPWS_16265 [Rhodomicrobium sp.]
MSEGGATIEDKIRACSEELHGLLHASFADLNHMERQDHDWNKLRGIWATRRQEYLQEPRHLRRIVDDIEVFARKSG